MVSPPEEGGIKDARNTDNNNIISDSTPRQILTPQLKKMSARYKIMFGCDFCRSAQRIHS